MSVKRSCHVGTPAFVPERRADYIAGLHKIDKEHKLVMSAGSACVYQRGSEEISNGFEKDPNLIQPFIRGPILPRALKSSHNGGSAPREQGIAFFPPSRADAVAVKDDLQFDLAQNCLRSIMS